MQTHQGSLLLALDVRALYNRTSYRGGRFMNQKTTPASESTHACKARWRSTRAPTQPRAGCPLESLTVFVAKSRSLACPQKLPKKSLAMEARSDDWGTIGIRGGRDIYTYCSDGAPYNQVHTQVSTDCTPVPHAHPPAPARTCTISGMLFWKPEKSNFGFFAHGLFAACCR